MGNSDHGTTYMTGGGDDRELRPWHYIYVNSIESRLIRRVMYESNLEQVGQEAQELLRIVLVVLVDFDALIKGRRASKPWYKFHGQDTQIP